MFYRCLAATSIQKKSDILDVIHRLPASAWATVAQDESSSGRLWQNPEVRNQPEQHGSRPTT
jgi:hypothetical protein